MNCSGITQERLFSSVGHQESAEPEIGRYTAAEGPEMFRRRQEPQLI